MIDTRTVTRRIVERRQFCAGCPCRTQIGETEIVVTRTWDDGGRTVFHFHPGCTPSELLYEVSA